METVYVRSSVVFFYSLTVLFVVSMGCAVTAMFFVSPTTVTPVDVSVLQWRLQRYELSILDREKAVCSVTANADLRKLFNWNVKQLFVWISAEFETNAHGVNEVSLWDKIIVDPKDAHLDLKDAPCKYGLSDFDMDLTGRQVNITMRWDVMPIVGLLKQGGGYESNSFILEMPKHYM